MNFDSFLVFTVVGLYSGAVYAIAASGLVLTYTTTRVFNMAHGALGMLMSFTFWEFSVHQGWPKWISVLLVLFVVAPAIGFLIQRVVARNLADAPVSVSLVVTFALMAVTIGISQQIWKPGANRPVEDFFPGKNFQLGSVYVSYHQAITIVAAVVVAILLWLLLNRTLIGTAMRAAVDNPVLLRLFGGKPDNVAALAWMISTSLAALAGVLLMSVVGLDSFSLTLLVINAYAAAMIGKLKSLPMTFLGGMMLGLASSYATGYLPPDGIVGQLKGVVPALFLFAAVILLPQTQLRVGQVKGLVAAPVPRLPKAITWGVVFVFLAYVVAHSVSTVNQVRMGDVLGMAAALLSLVLLTGYGGHVSLAQISFVGVGALVYCKVDEPNLWGFLAAGVVTALVGAAVALPVLRLTGLYLALATMAFSLLMDRLIFQQGWAFGYNGTLNASRPTFFGLTFQTDATYLTVMAFAFAVMGISLIALRRGSIGRILVAMRDSPAACGTLGLDTRWFRVGLFAASSGIAGVAGALFAGSRQTVGAQDFAFFGNFGLMFLLWAVVFGMTSVTGAFLGAVGLMLLPVLQSELPDLAGLLFALVAVLAILLAREPNGLAGYLFRFGNYLSSRYGPEVRARLPFLFDGDPYDEGEYADGDDWLMSDGEFDGDGDGVVPAATMEMLMKDGEAR